LQEIPPAGRPLSRIFSRVSRGASPSFPDPKRRHVEAYIPDHIWLQFSKSQFSLATGRRRDRSATGRIRCGELADKAEVGNPKQTRMIEMAE